jgi:hypothetical protein
MSPPEAPPLRGDLGRAKEGPPFERFAVSFVSLRADVVKRRGPVQPDLALARHAKPEHRDMPHAVRERAHPRQAQCLADRLAQRAREQTGEGQVCFELELEPRVYRSRARRVRLDQTAQRALQRRGSDAREARAPHAVGCEARQTTKHFEDDRFTLEIA